MVRVVDFIIRVKNGYLVRKELVVCWYSRVVEEIVKILKRERYIKEYQIEEENKKKTIKIFLLYKDKKPALNKVKLVSKPGRRIYTKVKDLKPFLGGKGLAILSTPKGIKTDKEAKKENVGGEVLLRVW